MPSLPPDSITATVFFMVHRPKSSINSSTYKTLLPACSPTPAPVTISPQFFRSSIGCLSLSAFTSKYSFSPTKPFITEPHATSPTCSTITLLHAASALMPTSCVHHSERSTGPGMTKTFSTAAPTP
ncbi:hypothetical protein ILYODFUR_020047 [Ilyodon furcidens]|uniref:Uncharacterized protein n=1 Tax=Ilyodon furcidens TaxID=33524 RepID=A0ABV0UVU5_9TELE